MTLYDVLGVESGASVARIRAAYRAKLLRLHPDKAGTQGSGDDAAAGGASAAQLDALHDAWNVLREDTSRARYDAQLAVESQQQEGVPWMSISVKKMDKYDAEDGHTVYEFECRCGDVFELTPNQLPQPGTVTHVSCRTCTSALAVQG